MILFMSFFTLVTFAVDYLIYKRVSDTNTIWNYLFCIGIYPYLFVFLYCIAVGIFNGSSTEIAFGIWLAVVVYWYISIPFLILTIISYIGIWKSRKKNNYF